MRVNILLLNFFNVQARQVLMESRLPNSVLSKVILNLMSSLFTLHYIAYTRFFMQTIFNGVAYECRRLRFGLLLTVTATECLTRRSSVSPCEIILRLVLFVQIPKNNRKVSHRVQTGGQRPALYSAPPPQAALPQVANLEEMIRGH